MWAIEIALNVFKCTEIYSQNVHECTSPLFEYEYRLSVI
jgi:hypothetical protein